MNDIISEMFRSKKKYDLKCKQNKLNVETMEEYMYTFLNQRYGLKALTISWASSIINGIRQFSKSDFEVHQFGKILRGQISEYHRDHSNSLKELINFFLKQTLEEKYHPLHKSEVWITDLESKIHTGNLLLEPWLYKKILSKVEQSTVSMNERGFLQASILEDLIL